MGIEEKQAEGVSKPLDELPPCKHLSIRLCWTYWWWRYYFGAPSKVTQIFDQEVFLL